MKPTHKKSNAFAEILANFRGISLEEAERQIRIDETEAAFSGVTHPVFFPTKEGTTIFEVWRYDCNSARTRRTR